MSTSNTFEFRGMNAEDMKKSYKRLVRINHPDLGGDLETMKVLNNEFAFWYATAATNEVKDKKTNERPQSADYYTNTYNAAFMANLSEAIEWLLNHEIYTRDDLTVELCGVFIWISGIALRDDATARAALKASNFRFSRDKAAWFFTATSTAGFMATGASLDKIRNTYGSQTITARRNAIGD